ARAAGGRALAPLGQARDLVRSRVPDVLRRLPVRGARRRQDLVCAEAHRTGAPPRLARLRARPVVGDRIRWEALARARPGAPDRGGSARRRARATLVSCGSRARIVRRRLLPLAAAAPLALSPLRASARVAAWPSP